MVDYTVQPIITQPGAKEEEIDTATEFLEENSAPILWNIVNALLAGALVLLGGLTTGHLDGLSIITAIVAAGLVAIAKFNEYWNTLAPKAFNFVGL